MPRCWKRYAVIAVTVFSFAHPLPANAENDAAYLQELQTRAVADKLDRDPYWHLLGHYRPTAFGGSKSEVDAPGFFLSPKGKNDPTSELQATIASFFDPSALDQKVQHPQCRFPARYAWLKERLALDASRLPEQACLALDAWLAEVNAGSATLVFASAFPEAPASMYGHTLLRLDRKGERGGQDLLSTIINYAAYPWTTFPPIYIYMGLMGGFEGRFSAMPYFFQVHRYSNMESRDLWEYPLLIDDAGLRRMMLHLWDLQDLYFDYYFLTENCSYHLLSLIEIARPDLKLRDQFSGITIPVDTIRAVQEAGGVGPAHFRPSHQRGMEARRAALSKKEQDLSLGLAEGVLKISDRSVNEISSARRVRVLESAHDLLRYRFGYVPDKQGKLEDEIARRENKILFARSTITETLEPISIREPPPPETGHTSRRAGVALRSDEAGNLATTISWRMALHDELDPQQGYTENSTLHMGLYAFNIYPELLNAPETRKNAFVLEQFDVVRIRGLRPWDSWTRHVSRSMTLGAQRIRDRDCATWECVAAHVDTGLGWTLATGPANFFALGVLAVEGSVAFQPAYRVTPSIQIGGIVALHRTLRLSIDVAENLDVLGDADLKTPYVMANGNLSLQLGPGAQLRLGTGYYRDRPDGSIGFVLYR